MPNPRPRRELLIPSGSRKGGSFYRILVLNSVARSVSGQFCCTALDSAQQTVAKALQASVAEGIHEDASFGLREHP